MLNRIGCKLVKYDPKSKGALWVEGNRRAVKQDAVLAVHHIRFEAVAGDIAELHIRPLLARQKAVRAAKRIDAPDEFVSEVFRSRAAGQRLPRHGVDHGEHILHAMIELFDQRALMRL